MELSRSRAHRRRMALVAAAAGALFAVASTGAAGAAPARPQPPKPGAKAAAPRGIILPAPTDPLLNSLKDRALAALAGGNGDQNPYDIAVVPATSGNLVAGNLLIALFNDTANSQGAGTTIVQVNPLTGDTADFAHGGDIAGPVGIAITPTDTVWVGDYGNGKNGSNALNGSAGNIAVLNSSGVETTHFNNASTSTTAFNGVWGQAISTVGGHTSFYWGTAGNATTGAGGGQIWRADVGGVTPTFTQIAGSMAFTAFGATIDVNSAAGPRGLTFDATTNTLYITDDANNTVYKIANANTATTSTAVPTVVSTSPFLSGPKQIAADPFNPAVLVVVNGGANNNIIKMTKTGTVLGVRNLDAVDPGGALFGVIGATDSTGHPVIYYDNSAETLLHSLSLGYWLVASDGGVFSYGSSRFFGSAANLKLVKPIVGTASTFDGMGYWQVASDGGIFAYGDATFHGSAGGLPLTKPIVGMAPTSDGEGYWLVASDGGIFAYGDATFHGSAGGLPLTKPIVGMAATPDDGGYWLVASDGGIFAYGDAVFYGSPAHAPLNQPVVGMAATPDGLGYWLVASDGGIFAYGDAAFHGSAGGIKLTKPFVGMASTGLGGGYWLFASDGGVFSYGDATFQGSAGGITLTNPIVNGTT